MISFPNCKINLGLNVISKRKDGYHNIETCMVPVYGLKDVVEIIRSKNDGVDFTTSGKTIDCPSEKNICVKAYRLIQEKFGIGGVKMHLHKNIPFGAGLGGGSADAVAVIKLLNEIYGLGMDTGMTRKLSLMLGSDTAFFVENVPAVCYGRGDITEKISLDLTGYFLVLVKPDVSVSTAEAYGSIDLKKTNKPVAEILRNGIDTWEYNLVNDFEDYVFSKYPELEDIKSQLYDAGAVYASMSGSGSAIYGLFETKPEGLKFEIENYLFNL
ncbi:MAG: 4-(cytidine 5'-diphospho)-2-C-methyl-D-erythritol kinase [Rikenellaceae bacterium]|nr:4-(cytidine 5'-diphospho)-2-C-methyl-D-erythritol kinase [Rikenellaceae bacterium]